VPINGIFVMALTVLITVAVAYIMYKSRWGRQVRAVVQNRIMAGAGRHQYREGRSLHLRASAAASPAFAAAPSP
jgi:ABC-type uncharacterized transport system permease subunit